MTNKRIKLLADFFYSSNSSRKVPMRISASVGMCGFDLNKEDFVGLMLIMDRSGDIKRDLTLFVENRLHE